MMKCQGQNPDGSPCGFEKEGGFKFCSSCGWGAPSETPVVSASVPCPGRDGKTCGSLIKPSFNFCPDCGLEVKPDVFKKEVEVIKCRKCSSTITTGTKFCSQCGHQAFEVERAVPEVQKDKVSKPQSSAKEKHVEVSITNPIGLSGGDAGAHKSKETNISLQDSTSPEGNSCIGSVEDKKTTVCLPKESSKDTNNSSTNVSKPVSTIDSGVVEGQKSTCPQQSADILKDSFENSDNYAAKKGQNDSLKSSEGIPTYADKAANLAPQQSNLLQTDLVCQSKAVPKGLGDQACTSNSSEGNVNNILVSSSVDPQNIQESKVTVGQHEEKDDKEATASKDGADQEDSEVDSADDKAENDAQGEAYKEGDGKPKEKKKKKWRGKKKSEQTEMGQMTSKPAEKNDNYLASRTKLKNAVDVKFHVLVSETWKFDPQKQGVHIHFGSELLQGWKHAWKMELEKDDAHKDVLHYVCTVPMPEDVKQQPLKYKYTIHQKNHVEWEELFFEFQTKDSKKNRTIKLSPEMNRTKGTWHQFDGFMYPERDSKGFLASMTEKYKRWTGSSKQCEKILDDTQQATLAFLPSEKDIMDCFKQELPSPLSSAELILERSYKIFTDMKKQMLDSSLKKTDPNFKEKIFCEFCRPLFHHLNKLVEAKDSSQSTLQMVLSSFLLLLAWKIDLSHTVMQSKDMFYSLLPQPNPERTECPNFETLQKHFTKYLR